MELFSPVIIKTTLYYFYYCFIRLKTWIIDKEVPKSVSLYSRYHRKNDGDDNNNSNAALLLQLLILFSLQKSAVFCYYFLSFCFIFIYL